MVPVPSLAFQGTLKIHPDVVQVRGFSDEAETLYTRLREEIKPFEPYIASLPDSFQVDITTTAKTVTCIDGQNMPQVTYPHDEIVMKYTSDFGETVTEQFAYPMGIKNYPRYDWVMARSTDTAAIIAWVKHILSVEIPKRVRIFNIPCNAPSKEM